MKNNFKFKHNDIVRYVNGWTTIYFKIENIYPSTCKMSHRYYGSDINGKAFAAHETELYNLNEKEILKWKL